MRKTNCSDNPNKSYIDEERQNQYDGDTSRDRLRNAWKTDYLTENVLLYSLGPSIFAYLSSDVLWKQVNESRLFPHVQNGNKNLLPNIYEKGKSHKEYQLSFLHVKEFAYYYLLFPVIRNYLIRKGKEENGYFRL